MKFSCIYQFTSLSANREISFLAGPTQTTNTDVDQALFDQLRRVFHTHARKQIGFFEPTPSTASLSPLLTHYHNTNMGAEQLGCSIAEQLKTELIRSQYAHSGYLWLVLEQGLEDEFLYLFFLEPETVYGITPELTISQQPSLQPSRLQYAVKVNLREWRAQDAMTYLTFLAPKNTQPLTLAWMALTEFATGIDKAVQTETFLTLLERYAESLPPEKEPAYRQRVVNFCLEKEKQGEPVEWKALSQHADETVPQALLEYLTEQVDEPTPVFYPDRKQLKRYTRFYGRADDLTISFSTMLFGSHILYDERTETLTIRAIPSALKSQLKKYLKELT